MLRNIFTRTVVVFLLLSTAEVLGFVPAPPIPALASNALVSSAQKSITNTLGAIPGSFRVGESGSANYTIPVGLPDGSGGLTPQLSLNYASTSGNGWVGIGWSLGGVTSVSRCRATEYFDGAGFAKPINFSESDRFCLGGQRLVLDAGGQYGSPGSTYKTSIDSFAKITAVGGTIGNPDYFVMEAKDGSITKFGDQGSAYSVRSERGGIRREDEEKDDPIVWSVSQITDSVGNKITFDYLYGEDGFRVSSISYAYDSNGIAHSKVIFGYETRQDEIRKFIVGYKDDIRLRLNKISVLNSVDGEPGLVREYNLNYKTVLPFDKTSRLSSINLCDASGECLQPTVFNWSPTRAARFGFDSSPSLSHTFSADRSTGFGGYQFADINGDGLQDIIWVEIKSNTRWKYMLNSGSGYSSPIEAFEKNNPANSWKVIDFNADGRADLAYTDRDSPDWKILLSTPDASGNWGFSGGEIDISVESDTHNVVFKDVNADGLVDAVVRVLGPSNSRELHVHYLEKNPNSADVDANFYRYRAAEVIMVEAEPTANGREITSLIPVDTGVTLDFNGDGRSDFLTRTVHNSSLRSRTLWLSDTDGDNVAERFASFNIEADTGSAYSIESYAETYGDINGDGLTDVIMAIPKAGSNTISWAYRLSDGRMLLQPVHFYDTYIPVDQDGSTREDFENISQQIIDFNQDGFPDFLWNDRSSSVLRVHLWSPALQKFATNYTVLSTSSDEDDTYQILDVNADGAFDYFYYDGAFTGHHLKIYHGETPLIPENLITAITNGSGAETNISYAPLSASGHYIPLNIDRNPTAEDSSQKHCRTMFDGSVCDRFVFDNIGDFYEELNGSWNLPAGAHTFGKDGNNDQVYDPVLSLNGPMPVVTSVSSSAPRGSDVTSDTRRGGNVIATAASTVSYYYADARIQAKGVGMLGFGALLTRDEQSKVTTTTLYRQDYPFVGSPLETTVRSEDGHLLRRATNEWRLHQWSGSGSYAKSYYQPYIHQSIEETYDLVGAGSSPGNLMKTVTTTRLGDSEGYGNVPQISVVTSGDNKIYKTVTQNTYGTSADDKRFGRLSHSTVTKWRDEDGLPGFEKQATRSASFQYYPSGIFKGLLSAEFLEKGNTQYEQKTTYSYDDFGNKVKSVVRARNPQTRLFSTRCNTRTAFYDATGRYLDEQRDCLGRKTSLVIERNNLGQPTQVRQYLTAGRTNDYVDTFLSYTASGRKYFEADQSGAYSASTLSECDSSCSPESAFYSSTWGPANNANDFVELSRDYVDVLGRSVRKARRGFDGTWIYQDIEYDAVGRVQRTSVPYFAGSSPTAWTASVYDILGRLTKTYLPDDSGSNNMSTVSHQGFTTLYTNALNQTREETHNVLGDVVEVKDNAGGRIRYAYDARGNLKTTTNVGSVSEPRNVVISINYDRLDRKVDINDPDKGRWEYEYTAFGELEKQINSKAQYTTFEYDGLGRRKSRQDFLSTGKVEGETIWTYDTASHGLGQVAEVRDDISGYIKVMEYDSLGRPSKTVTSLGVNGALGDHFEKVTYDQFGRQYQVFDAARNSDSYTDNGTETRYNDYGYIHQTVDVVYSGNSTRKVYHTILEVDARGNVTQESLGNGVSRRHEYDEETGRLKRVYASRAGTLVQDLRKTWDDIGNLDYVWDYGKGGASTQRNLKTDYQYDNMNRLKNVGWYRGNSLIRQQNLTYDILGNIKTKSGVGAYLYDEECGCGPHAVTKAGNTTFQYDANGNMVRDSDGRKIAYTTFGKPYHIEKGGNRVTFAYGPSRSRYVRRDISAEGTKTTLYIGAVEKITNTDGSKEWKRYLGDSLMIDQTVSINDSVISTRYEYLLKDHLGSIQYILDASGFVIQSMLFDPWGERLTDYQDEGSAPWFENLFSVLHTTRGFTGHEMVDGMDIVHMNGRIYDSRLGRFLQADPFIDGTANTQGYNRYSYGKNNPLNGTDPSGYGFFKELFDDVLGFTENPVLSSVATIAVCATPGVNAVGCVGTAAFFSSSTTYAATGDVGAALRAGVISGVSAAAFSSLGQEFTWADFINPSSLAKIGETFAINGSVGGVLAELGGGSFGHGFLAAGIGSVTPNYGGFEGFITKLVVSGTISEVTGGKFANGAATAAMYWVAYNGVKELSYWRYPNSVPNISQEEKYVGNDSGAKEQNESLAVDNANSKPDSQIYRERYKAVKAEQAEAAMKGSARYPRLLKLLSRNPLTKEPFDSLEAKAVEGLLKLGPNSGMIEQRIQDIEMQERLRSEQ